MPYSPAKLKKPEPVYPRDSAAARGYGRRWRWAAKCFLDKYPLCGMRPGNRPPVMSQCYEQGLTTAATVVDHVVPHRGDQQIFWAEVDRRPPLARIVKTVASDLAR